MGRAPVGDARLITASDCEHSGAPRLAVLASTTTATFLVLEVLWHVHRLLTCTIQEICCDDISRKRTQPNVFMQTLLAPNWT